MIVCATFFRNCKSCWFCFLGSQIIARAIFFSFSAEPVEGGFSRPKSAARRPISARVPRREKHILVSYHHDSQDFVEQLVKELEKERFKVRLIGWSCTMTDFGNYSILYSIWQSVVVYVIHVGLHQAWLIFSWFNFPNFLFKLKSSFFIRFLVFLQLAFLIF